MQREQRPLRHQTDLQKELQTITRTLERLEQKIDKFKEFSTIEQSSVSVRKQLTETTKCLLE